MAQRLKTIYKYMQIVLSDKQVIVKNIKIANC